MATTAAVLTACALPASAAAAQDMRSPDARDAAAGIGLYAQPASTSQGPRSPDARDAAAQVGVYASDAPRTQAPVTAVTVAESTGGFDWGDAGIGAVGMLALVCIAVGGALLAGTRRRRGVGVAAS